MFKIFVFFIFLLLPKGLFAQSLNINYGANFIDIDGNGIKYLITKVYIENGNAHSFDKYQIAINKNEVYQAIAIDNQHNYDLNTVNGADCQRTEFLFHIKDDNLIVIRAYLPNGEINFCEEKIAFFETFEIFHNENFITGFPEYYLKLQNQKHSKNLYQDINQAIKQELQ